jgi:hypothetical protein
VKEKAVWVASIVLLLSVVVTALVGMQLGLDFASNMAVVSMVVSVITLAALYAQNRHLRHQVDSMMVQTEIAISDAAYTKAFEMQQVFIEHSDLWAYFHHGKEINDDCPEDLRAKLEALALLKLDYFSLIEAVYRRGDSDIEDRLSNEAYLLHAVAHSPVLREVFAKHHNWYPKLAPYFALTKSGPI